MLDDVEMQSVLTKIQSCRTRKFLDLVKVAELDPKTDFRYADLRNSDFSGQDLRAFDFSYSTLYDSNFKSATFNIKSLENAYFFQNPNLSDFTGVERRTANLVMLAPRYFQRVAAMAALSISNPGHSTSNLLRDAAYHERSRYASDYASKAAYIIDSDVSKREKKAILAQEAYRQSYPLARQQYHSALRDLSADFPIMKSYFDFL